MWTKDLLLRDKHGGRLETGFKVRKKHEAHEEGGRTVQMISPYCYTSTLTTAEEGYLGMWHTRQRLLRKI
jgi:hypothetical protein